MDNQDFFIANTELANLSTWSDEESKGVDAGDYEAVVTELAREPSSQKGLPQLKVTFEITAEATGKTTSMKGRKVFARYNEQGKGAARLKNFLEATGVRIDGRGANVGEARGAKLLLTCYKEEYMGEDLNGNKVPRVSTKVHKERPATNSR